MKPSERLEKMKMDCEERYADQDIDTRMIATLLNMVKEIGIILDEHEGIL